MPRGMVPLRQEHNGIRIESLLVQRLDAPDRLAPYGANFMMQSVMWAQVGQQSPNLFCDLSRVMIFNR